MSASPELPPAASTLDGLFDWCVARARTLPFRVIAAESLVWKLAGLVQAASAGRSSNHTFENAELLALFEQLAISLQRFPEAPSAYRPHAQEPAYDSDRSVRVVVAPSGAGKSAWATQVGIHCGARAIYHDASLGNEGALAAGVLREIVAGTLKDDHVILGEITHGGLTPLESLRRISLRFAEKGTPVTAIVDDAHRASVEELAGLGRATSPGRLQLVIVTQPWPGLAECEARLGVTAEHLTGWALEVIAAECASLGCSIDPVVAARMSRITAGMPMFVREVASLARTRGVAVIDICAELEALTHTEGTRQEAILARVFDVLPPDVRSVAALLSLADVPLSREEILAFVEAGLSISPQAVAKHLRELSSWGLTRARQDGSVILHDAFRLLASAAAAALDQGILQLAGTALLASLVESLRSAADPARLLLFLRLLRRVGRVTDFVDQVALKLEELREFGLLSPLASELEGVASALKSTGYERFWAWDALAFIWEGDEQLRAVKGMADVLEVSPDAFGAQEHIAFAAKMGLIRGRRFDETGVLEAFDTAMSGAKSEAQRMALRYIKAVSLYSAGAYEKSLSIASELAGEHEVRIGISEEGGVVRIPRGDGEALVHLANCYDLAASSRSKLNKSPMRLRARAYALYNSVGAHASAVKTGLELATELMDLESDMPKALNVLDTILSITREQGILSQEVPISALRAVALAHLGRIDEARAEMERLRPYADALTGMVRDDFHRQFSVVEDLAAGHSKS